MSWILLASPNDFPCSPKCNAPTLGDCIRDGRQCLNESPDDKGCEYCGSFEINPQCPACQGFERDIGERL